MSILNAVEILKTVSLKRLTLTAPILCLSLFALPAHSESGLSEMQKAEKLIGEYKALRSACTMYKHEQKHNCYRQLRASTAAYKSARRFLATQSSSGESSILVVSQ